MSISLHAPVESTTVRFVVVDSADATGANSTDVIFTARELAVSMDRKPIRMARSVDILVNDYRIAFDWAPFMVASGAQPRLEASTPLSPVKDPDFGIDFGVQISVSIGVVVDSLSRREVARPSKFPGRNSNIPLRSTGRFRSLQTYATIPGELATGRLCPFISNPR